MIIPNYVYAILFNESLGCFKISIPPAYPRSISEPVLQDHLLAVQCFSKSSLFLTHPPSINNGRPPLGFTVDADRVYSLLTISTLWFRTVVYGLSYDHVFERPT